MEMDLCTLYISPRECGMGELLVKRVESTWECPVFQSQGWSEKCSPGDLNWPPISDVRYKPGFKLS